MKKFLEATLLTLGMLVIIPLACLADDVHPKKKIFKDVESWPATAPGQVKLKNFGPFRAVYDRTYSQGSGPNAGDPRNDRVIISAEETGWDGKRAAAITIIDSGIVEHSDTNARVATIFAALDDLRLLFEIGPISGKAKDYYIARIDPEMLYLNNITTDTNYTNNHNSNHNHHNNNNNNNNINNNNNNGPLSKVPLPQITTTVIGRKDLAG